MAGKSDRRRILIKDAKEQVGQGGNLSPLPGKSSA
jgi:hypothetical protein